jgi:hypothetical protein
MAPPQRHEVHKGYKRCFLMFFFVGFVIFVVIFFDRIKVKPLFDSIKKSIDPVIALEYGACKTKLNLPFETKAGINPARFIESNEAN